MEKDRPFRILATGDMHADISAIKKLAEKAEKENVDLVVICGDLTHKNQDHQQLISPFLKKNKRVLFVPGNHDSFAAADFWEQMYDVKNIHGKGVIYYHIGFFGCGGANIGLEQLSEDDFIRYLREGHDKVKDLSKKIMVTHIHPKDSIPEKMTGFPGSEGIRKAITEFKPDIHLCCHVHEAEGIEETIGNTRMISVGKEGTIIDL